MIIPWYRSGVDVESNTFQALVELPGIKKKDLKVTISEDGFCVIFTDDDGTKTHRCYPFGHPVNSKLAKAKYSDGLLSLVIPLKEEALGKEIKVE